MNKCIIFSHTDLDGVGGVIVGREVAKSLALEPEHYMCNYNDINDTVEDRLNKGVEDVSLIIIVDISVNEDVALHLNEINEYTDTTVKLVDHHDTASWLNKYSWASVHELVDGVERCGTYQLAYECQVGLTKLKEFITLVDDWDTWKWSTNGNELAKKMNGLYQVIGKQSFIEYIEYICGLDIGSNIVIDNPNKLFNSWASNMIEAHEMAVNKSASSCENSMWITELKIKKYHYKCGVVFINSDISDIADIILSNNPKLDILMCIGLPRNISFRTKKTLEVPLGDIAKLMTGSGGGHPQAAGCVLDKKQFGFILASILATPAGVSMYNNELSFIGVNLYTKEDNKCVE